MTSTDKGLYFFKVFDLSFFAPGLVIALTLAWIWDAPLNAIKAPINTAAGIIALIAAIGAIYILGLTVFSIMWAFYRWKPRTIASKIPTNKNDPETPNPESTHPQASLDWPPFPLLFKAELRDELILYFWYLRATCLGLACAFLISVVMILAFTFSNSFFYGASIPWTQVGILVVMDLIATGFLIHRGRKFGLCVDRSLEQRARDWHEAKQRE